MYFAIAMSCVNRGKTMIRLRVLHHDIVLLATVYIFLRLLGEG
jgi:hypothetical protein